MVSEVWPSLRRSIEKETSQDWLEMASGRSLPQDEWRPALLVASRGPERSHHRHPGAAAARSLGGIALLSKIARRHGENTSRDRHRQIAELRRSEAADLAHGRASARSLSKQPRRELASTHPRARTTDETLSVFRTRTKFSIYLRVYLMPSSAPAVISYQQLVADGNSPKRSISGIRLPMASPFPSEPTPPLSAFLHSSTRIAELS